MKKEIFKYYTEIPYYNIQTSFVVRLEKVYSKEQIFQQYYYGLWFPSWFGFNWDALRDSLCYLGNIKEDNIIIIHQSLPELNENELKIYLEILLDTNLFWTEQNKNLPINFEELIEILDLFRYKLEDLNNGNFNFLHNVTICFPLSEKK